MTTAGVWLAMIAQNALLSPLAASVCRGTERVDYDSMAWKSAERGRPGVVQVFLQPGSLQRELRMRHANVLPTVK